MSLLTWLALLALTTAATWAALTYDLGLRIHIRVHLDREDHQ
ncbi:MAG TPA: hypothetical protein VFU14_14045 [Acidimicrobiales bacterium]|nr:hypothetical protein [Acidimicrobiales bacterium]